jgi:hypothetical protein
MPNESSNVEPTLRRLLEESRGIKAQSEKLKAEVKDVEKIIGTLPEQPAPSAPPSTSRGGGGTRAAR